MKKFFLLSFLGALIAGAVPEARAAHNLANTRHACVQVILSNGETFEGQCKLPEGWSTKPIVVRPEQGKSRKFAVDRIAALVVWAKKQPEKQYVMRRIVRPVHNKKGKWKRDLEQWMVLEAAGTHLAVYMGASSYEFHRRRGTLVGVLPQYTVPAHVGVKTGATRGTWIGDRESLLQFLADDPTLCRRIADNEIAANDYATIVEVYEPHE